MNGIKLYSGFPIPATTLYRKKKTIPIKIKCKHDAIKTIKYSIFFIHCNKLGLSLSSLFLDTSGASTAEKVCNAGCCFFFIVMIIPNYVISNPLTLAVVTFAWSMFILLFLEKHAFHQLQVCSSWS